MDWISELPDALLLQILSFVPTKDLVSTSVLSKRWETLWMLVPNLKYDVEYGSDSRLVSRFLLLHKAPVLESLCLKIKKFHYSHLDIGIWVRTAVDRRVRTLEIELYPSGEDPIRLPRRFYTCETLKVLTLTNASLLRSLKTLHLLSVKYSDEKSFETLLSSCSSLKDLVVKCCPLDNSLIFTIKIPSLQRLSLDNSSKKSLTNCQGFVFDAPSLKYLNLVDYRGYFCLTGDMPELVEADLDIVYDKLDKLLGSLTSVKRLSVCSTYSSPPIGTTFLKLVYLELCTCEPEWQNLPVCLLKVTPKLRVLKLKRTHNDCNKDGCWNQPDSVPYCLLTSLEIFEWRKYKGTKDQRYVATYILRNSCYLKMAKIRTKSDDNGKQLEMLKKLSFTPRASATCEVDFE